MGRAFEGPKPSYHTVCDSRLKDRLLSRGGHSRKQTGNSAEDRLHNSATHSKRNLSRPYVSLSIMINIKSRELYSRLGQTKRGERCAAVNHT